MVVPVLWSWVWCCAKMVSNKKWTFSSRIFHTTNHDRAIWRVSTIIDIHAHTHPLEGVAVGAMSLLNRAPKMRRLTRGRGMSSGRPRTAALSSRVLSFIVNWSMGFIHECLCITSGAFTSLIKNLQTPTPKRVPFHLVCFLF